MRARGRREYLNSLHRAKTVIRPSAHGAAVRTSSRSYLATIHRSFLLKDRRHQRLFAARSISTSWESTEPCEVSLWAGFGGGFLYSRGCLGALLASELAGLRCRCWRRVLDHFCADPAKHPLTSELGILCWQSRVRLTFIERSETKMGLLGIVAVWYAVRCLPCLAGYFLTE